MSRRRKVLLAVLLVTLVLAGIRALTVGSRPPHAALAGRTPLVWAHQGASGYAPSNTLESFRLAVEMGADVLETDLQLTKDGVLVLSHDETVDRLTDGYGRIADQTLEELKRLDAGARFVGPGPDGIVWRGRGAKIPTLDEFFSAFAGLDNGRLKFSLELKTTVPPMEELLWAAIRKHRIEDRIMVGSFHQAAMDRFRALAGGRVATMGAPTEMFQMIFFWKTGLSFLWQPGMDMFAVPTGFGPLRTDSPSFTALARSRGIHVTYWTVNDPADMRRLLELGANGIITDFPDRALREMKALGLR